jgi:diazepam-binding inhibitor (GABA receptor modulating acyl-CoA-binding protein)
MKKSGDEPNIKGLKDNEKLELYALFKQATVGDVNTPRPGLFDLKGKAKWDAWEKKKGITLEQAQIAYTNYANNLFDAYNLPTYKVNV